MLSLKQNELAIACGVSRAAVNIAIRDGRLVLENNRINLETQRNKDFIQTLALKGKVFDINRVTNKGVMRKNMVKNLKLEPKPKPEKPAPIPKEPKPVKVPKIQLPEKTAPVPFVPMPPPEKPKQKEIQVSDFAKINSEINDGYSLEREKVQAEIDLKKSTLRLNDLKEQKLRGELVPTDAVQTLFSFAVEEIRTTYINEVVSLANVYRQLAGLSHSQFVNLQKELTEKVNGITLIFKDNLASGVEGVVDEYKEVRGRGERK